jgi:butyrate kinase
MHDSFFRRLNPSIIGVFISFLRKYFLVEYMSRKRFSRDEVLKFLLELDPYKAHRYSRLVRFLYEKGLSYNAAERWIKLFAAEGFLKKIDLGFYMIDKQLIEKELEKYERNQA